MNAKHRLLVTACAPLINAVLIFLFCAASPVMAGLNTYSARPAFITAAGAGLALADFEGLPGDTSYQILNSGINATIPVGVTFSSSAGGVDDLFVASAGFNGNPAIATQSLFANYFGTPLIANFSPNVTAIGANLIPFDFAGNTATISVSVHDAANVTSVYNVTPPVGSSEFFGVIGTGGTVIDRITYTPPAGFTAGIDDFVFGLAVPEPSTLFLTIAALACLTAHRRKSTLHDAPRIVRTGRVEV